MVSRTITSGNRTLAAGLLFLLSGSVCQSVVEVVRTDTCRATDCAIKQEPAPNLIQIHLSLNSKQSTSR